MRPTLLQHVRKSGPAATIVRALAGALAAAIVSMLAPALTCQAQSSAVITSANSTVLSAASMPGAAASISRISAGAETLHVLVGHAIFLNTKFRLRKVYVADPNILNSLTMSPNQVIITAMLPGTSSLIVLDETGQAQSYVVSSDVDVQGLRAAIADVVHGDEVNVEAIGGRVMLSGHASNDAIAESAVKLAQQFSKDVTSSIVVVPVHPKQVRLKVRILEVDRSKINQFGVNLFNPGGNTSFLASTSTSQFPSTSTLAAATTTGTIGTLTTSNPLNFLLYSAKLNLGLTIQDLESKQVLQVLAEPTITTISGQKANFLAGGEFPFPVVQPGGGSGSSSSVTISFRPYGVKLEFTPQVNADGTIRLKVAPEVSALDYTNAVSISGYTIPALSTRKAETEVELRSNQSFAISGLLDQRTTDSFSKTPGAASIPIIGALFKSKNINHATTELIVIVTPTLVDPLSEGMEAPMQPEVPIPTLNTNKFDKSLGSHHNPKPAAPPIDPSTPLALQNLPGATPRPAAPVNAAAQPVSADAPDAAAATVVVPMQEQTIPAGATEVQPAPAQATPVAQPVPAASDSGTQGPQKYVFVNPAASISNNAPVEAAPQPAAPQPAGQPTIQIMALSRREDADTMVTALKRRGYDVAVTQDSRDSLLHLQLGPFSNQNDAEIMRLRLIQDGYNATLK